jgi:hypothetical protein
MTWSFVAISLRTSAMSSLVAMCFTTCESMSAISSRVVFLAMSEMYAEGGIAQIACGSWRSSRILEARALAYWRHALTHFGGGRGHEFVSAPRLRRRR